MSACVNIIGANVEFIQGKNLCWYKKNFKNLGINIIIMIMSDG
jgi:hypothetical protein